MRREVLAVLILVALGLILAVWKRSGSAGFFNTSHVTVRLPSRVSLRDGSTLQLAFISNEDIRTLIQEANKPNAPKGLGSVWDPPPEFVQLSDGYKTLPWRLLDVDVALHRIRSEGLQSSGWMSVPRVVTHKSLNEGEHIPRFLTEADVRVLRRGNGCSDEDAKCGQYKLNLSTGEPEVHNVTTSQMIAQG
jgi:hypothetical protein